MTPDRDPVVARRDRMWLITRHHMLMEQRFRIYGTIVCSCDTTNSFNNLADYYLHLIDVLMKDALIDLDAAIMVIRGEVMRDREQDIRDAVQDEMGFIFNNRDRDQVAERVARNVISVLKEPGS